MDKKTVLEARSLRKQVTSPEGMLTILDDVSLAVAAGETVAVVGASGAGKSTLLHILGMLDADFTGEYRFDGQAVHALRPKDRADLNRRFIGFVFQSYHLIDDLTVYENLETPLSYRNLGRRERQAVVCDLLDRFGIVGKRDLYPSQLSGGQQQLVGVARAVAAKPRLLLADEPTGNLHSDQGREIMELFRRLNDEGTTIIQVTHAEANAAYGNRVVRLFDGWMAGDPRAGTAPATAPGGAEAR